MRKELTKPDLDKVRQAIQDGRLRDPEIRRLRRYLESERRAGKTWEMIAAGLELCDASAITRLRDAAGLRERLNPEIYSLYEESAA